MLYRGLSWHRIAHICERERERERQAEKRERSLIHTKERERCEPCEEGRDGAIENRRWDRERPSARSLSLARSGYRAVCVYIREERGGGSTGAHVRASETAPRLKRAGSLARTRMRRREASARESERERIHWQRVE